MSGKRKSAIPTNETKEAKLIRLATARTNRIMKSISALGNLARLNPTNAQTEKVFGAIKAVAENSYARWKGEKAEAQSFSF